MKHLCKVDFSWAQDVKSACFKYDYEQHLKEAKNECKFIDFVLFKFFFFVSFYIHFKNIEYPKTSCFDETYFVILLIFILKKEFFIDIHPPLSKLILYVGCMIQGYKGKCSFINGNSYSDCRYEKLRKSLDALYYSLLPHFVVHQ